MARKEKPIISPTGGTPAGGEVPPAIIRGIDRGLSIQRPAVLAHLRSIRRRSPDATPAQLVRILERRYLAAVTTGGAAVGATAVIPGIGTGLTLVLSGIETAGFLEATSLYAQSVAEVHGIAVEDPERARALIMTMMLGAEGTDLVRQFAGQVTGDGIVRGAYWGEVVTNSIPRAILVPLVDRLKSSFIRRFTVGAGASVLGKAIPFGVGAVIGGAGNQIVGRRVVKASRLAFGMPPATLSPELEPRGGVIVLHDGRTSAGERFVKARGTVASGVLKVLPTGRRKPEDQPRP